MKRMLVTTIAALSMLASTSYAQLDLGGAISGAINQATGGGAQSGAQVGAQAGTQLGGQAGTQLGAQAGTQIGAPRGTLGTQAGAQLGGQLGSQIGGAAAGQSGANVGGNIGARAGANLGTNIGGGNRGNARVDGSLNSRAQPGTNQSWLGRVGNDLRSALQPGADGNMQLQGSVNQSLQQYGFRPGDQLLDVNGQPLRQDQVDNYLQQSPNQIRVLRNGQTVMLDGNVRAYGQSNYAQGQSNTSQGGVRASGRQRFGITMSPTTNAVLISSVTQGSPAASAGLRSGDQIVAINGQAVNSPNEMIQLVGQADANTALDVEYRRNGQSMRSQVSLTGSANADVRQAGFSNTQTQVPSGAQSGDSQRIDRLERMVEELRDEVRRLTPAEGSDSQP